MDVSIGSLALSAAKPNKEGSLRVGLHKHQHESQHELNSTNLIAQNLAATYVLNFVMLNLKRR